jgi:hypothetical protein
MDGEWTPVDNKGYDMTTITVSFPGYDFDSTPDLGQDLAPIMEGQWPVDPVTAVVTGFDGDNVLMTLTFNTEAEASQWLSDSGAQVA